MAEPYNTPMPTAPGTPVPGTPRATSPAPASASGSGAAPVGGLGSPPAPLPPGANPVVVPVPAPGWRGPGKPVVLHIGDPVRYNPALYAEFSALFDVVRPPAEERERAAFARALRERRWGDFAAIFRPFWATGGEMGQWDRELVQLLPDSVRVFASAGAGFDWADTQLLGERGIIYCNSGLAAADAVADFAMAMVISTFRVLPGILAAAASGSPAAFRDCHLGATAQSHKLRGRTLGLVGLGMIGQEVARRAAHGFGMRVLYHDVERKPAAVESQLVAVVGPPPPLPPPSITTTTTDGPGAGGCVFRPSLAQLAAESDCVVLCAPAAAGAKLIDAEALRHFRPGSRFVNVARGSLVDEEALADALDDGRLSAVGLDVHGDEPAIHPRLAAYAHSKAMLTCHNAGGTVETHVGFEELSMRNIIAVLSGDKPITPVNLHHVERMANL